MARRHGLRDTSILTRPTNAPVVHGANAFGPFLTQQLCKRVVAQSAPGRDCILVVMAPMVGSFGPESDGNGHLRHHCRAAAADEAAISEKYATAATGRFNCRIHACGS